MGRKWEGIVVQQALSGPGEYSLTLGVSKGQPKWARSQSACLLLGPPGYPSCHALPDLGLGKGGESLWTVGLHNWREETVPSSFWAPSPILRESRPRPWGNYPPSSLASGQWVVASSVTFIPCTVCPLGQDLPEGRTAGLAS